MPTQPEADLGHESVRFSSALGFNRILIAVDESQPARWAVEAARKLGASQAPVHFALVHVVQPVPAAYGEFIVAESAPPAMRETGERLLRDRRKLLPADASVELLLREGLASDEIVAVARSWDADVVVMGSHARGRVAQLLLGSVAQQVLRRAPCPVLLTGQPPRCENEPTAATGDVGHTSTVSAS